MTANLILSLSGNELELTGDTTVSSLTVTYNPTSETYTFTANSGETFAADGSVPGTVTFTPDGATATLAPSGENTWSGLTYSVGTNTQNSIALGTQLTLGSPAEPASNFGTAFDIANSDGGVTTLEIDDTGDSTNQTVAMSSSSLTIGGAPEITYGNASFVGWGFNAGSGADTVNVNGAPACEPGNSATLTMGSSTSNVVNVGDSSDAAADFNDIKITGTTALTIDDSDDTTGQTVTITSSDLTFGESGPTVDYSSTSLTSLTFDASNEGSNTINVAGSPALNSALAPITLDMGDGDNNAVNLGDSSDAADALGDVTVTTGAGGATGLNIDDSDGVASTIGVTGTTTTFTGGPTFTYGGASLFSMNLTTSGVSGNVVNVTGVPVTTGMFPLIIWTSLNGTLTVNVGDAEVPASQIGSLDINALDAPIALTVDDSAGSGSAAVGITNDELAFIDGPTFSYQGSVLSSLTFDAASAGSNAVTVSSSPMADLAGDLAPITLTMGTGNSVELGDASDAAAALGNVTITGTAGLTVDDADDTNGQTVSVTDSSLTIGTGPLFDYSGATLQSLTFDGASASTVTDTVNVSSMPTLPDDVSMSLAMGHSTANEIYLGDAGDAAADLGDVAISGTAGLTINDGDDSTSQLWFITTSGIALSGGSTFAYSTTVDDSTTYADIQGLTFDGGTIATAVDVSGSPHAGAGLSVVILNMGTSTSNAITLGGPSDAASTLGNVTVSGNASLSIDDSDDASPQTISETSSRVIIGATAPVFTYSGATLTGLTIKAPKVGSSTVNVASSPAGPDDAFAPVSVNMGTGTGNMVDFGQRADTFGTATVTTETGGTTGIKVDDSTGNDSYTIGVTATAISFNGGATYNYGGATLSGLEIDTDNNGGNVLNVTGVPTLPVISPMVISAFSGGTNTVNLGDPTHAASALGSIRLGSGSGAPFDLTIDDSGDASHSATVAISSTQVDFTGGPTFDLTNATVGSLTFDASNQGLNTVTVTGSPSENPGLATMTLNMGQGADNAVRLGDASHAASALGNVTVTTTGTPPDNGSTGLTVDDFDGAGGETVTIGAMSMTFTGGPTISYCGADLTGLTLDASAAGGNTITVTGSPELIAYNTVIADAAPEDNADAITVGDAENTASSLAGDVWVEGSGAASLTIDDAADTGSHSNLLDSEEFSFGASPVVFVGAATGLTGLTIRGSSGGDTWDVVGTPAGVPVTLDANPGTSNTDTMTLGGDTADTAAATLGNVTINDGGQGVIALTIDDTDDTTGQTIDVGATATNFTDGPTFTYSGASLAGLTLDASSAGGNDITVTGSPQLVAYPTIIDDSAPTDNADTISIGNHLSSAASQLGGNVTVTGTGAASLTINDSLGDSTGGYFIQAGEFTIGAYPAIDFSGETGLTSLNLIGGSGGNHWSITGTPTGVPVSIHTNPAPGQADTVTIGSPTHPASTMSRIVVHGDGTGATSLLIDDSADTASRTETLASNGSGISDLSGLNATSIGYETSTVGNVTLMQGTGSANTLTVDFSSGNPLPSGDATSFHYGATLGADNTLVLEGELPDSTPFDSETYAPTANETGAGVITLTSGAATSTLNFGGLTPIVDTAVSRSFTFVAPSNSQVVNMTNGTLDELTTDIIASGDTPSAFEEVTFANKADVLVDLSAETNPTYVTPPPLLATGLQSLTFKYFGDDTTGHTLVINGTTPGMTNGITLGGYGNTLDVEGVTAGGPLVVNNDPGMPGGVNSVVIGDNGSLANIGDGVTILGPNQSTDLTVDGSAETTPFADMLLELNVAQTLADLTGVLPGGMLAYTPTAIKSFSLSTGTGSDNLTVDFVNGNPFFGQGGNSPQAAPYTLDDNGGGGGDSLTFQDTGVTDGPLFNSETYAATGPNSGNVSFYNGTSSVYQGGVDFSNLTPTTDSTPVTNYTFTAPTSGGSIAVTDDATAGYTLISGTLLSPSFESVAYSNKENVTIDATAVSVSNAFVLNNPTAATGQSELWVELGSGNDTVTVSANPEGVTTLIDGGVGSQAITVNGAGLAAGTSATNFGILGGTGPDTMRLDAQGTGGPAVLTPATLGGVAKATFGTGDASTSMAFLNIGTIQEFATNDAPTFVMSSPLPTIPASTGVALINVPVATFQDADLIENASSYLATINWGDGTAPTIGAIAAVPGTPGEYVISGSHTYLSAGNDAITVTLTDLGGTFNSTLDNAGGAVVPVSTQLDAIAAVGGNTATASVIADPDPTPTPTPPDPPAPTLSWGRLSPQSDSGVSNSDGITNVTTPTFVGGATPGSIIQVFETPTGSSAAPVLIATGVADNSGAWAATVVGSTMADGSYQITATATDSGGNASASLGTVVIDTVAPVITDVVFRRQRGEMDVYFQDNLSGMFLADLSNGANYQVSATPLNNHIAVPRVIIPTGVTVIPGATPNSVDEVIIKLNHGKALPAGHYSFQVIAAGITDIAGNALNGRFYGSYPSGNMDPGGNYQAQITAFPRKVLGAFPYKTGYARPKPVSAAQSMARTEAVAAARPKHVAQAQVATSQPTQGHADLVDQAIAALAGHVRRRHRS